MADDGRGVAPLTPVYPFGQPDSAIVLYDGPIDGVSTTTLTGRIEMSFGSSPGLRWSVEPDPDDYPFDLGPVKLRLSRRGQDWAVDAYRRSTNDGWITHAEFVSPNTDLSRVVVHWINLPDILGRTPLSDDVNGRRWWWSGRWQVNIDGWTLTLDGRPDHGEVLKDAHLRRVYVLTHVMEVRRSDGGKFDVAAVQHLLEALRVGLSFAFGRWVAPCLPIGYDLDDRTVWETWTSPICDPAKRVGSAWLYRGQPDDLTEFVTRTVTAFNNPDRMDTTRFQMQVAVQTVESGFVEQRIITAFPALENLAWQTLVLGGRMGRREYMDERADMKLRQLLADARVPTDIDPVALPALAAFAESEHLDGPTAVTRVRNRLIHPKSPRDQIYRHDGLVEDVWQLVRHYLTLLILHSIGYRGSYVKLVPLAGWEGETAPVPWATP